MYSPLTIANRFIELASQADMPITQMQAQKLTYIAHGVSLGQLGRPLLSDPVCAWRYGPVIPALYHALKNNGSAPIKQPVSSMWFGGEAIDPATDSLIESVFAVYGRYSGETLSEFTHRTGTPWDQATKNHVDIIPNSLIQQYYQRLMQRDPNCIGL